MKPNKNGDVFKLGDSYEKLVRGIEQLMGRDAHLSRNCTDIECPNALLCLTTKMVPIRNLSCYNTDAGFQIRCQNRFGG